MSDIEGRVLSIQSHVVSGYVGNKSATFPLQVLGFEVDAINSVQFSNHTGYSYFKGQVLNAKELDELITGLRLNNIHNYSHLLTGYVGDPSFLQKVVDFAKELRQVNPRMVYVCDPVLGDNNKMYVPESLLPIYQNEVIPLANIITPNLYEAELLSGINIKNESDAFEAMNILHAKGPETIVITSMDADDSSTLIGLASTHSGSNQSRLRIKIPRISASFTGTGDLFSACFLAWMAKTKGDLKISMEKSMGTLQDVLKRTERIAIEKAGRGAKPTVAQLELRLIQSKADIENPKTKCDIILK